MPGAAGSDPEELVAAGGVLFFSAETPGKGRELWRATPPVEAVIPLSRVTSVCLGGSGDLTAAAFRTAGAAIVWESGDGDEEDDDHR